jgi:hypothetical protein
MKRDFSYSEPDCDVRVGWVSGATSVLLITERFHNNWVVERAYSVSQQSAPMFSPEVGSTRVLLDRSSVLTVPSLPLREASRGFISKISTPCIFPKISNRSNPVACSRSLGTVPTGAPGGMRSVSLWISVFNFISPYPHIILFPYFNCPSFHILFAQTIVP